MVNLRTHRGPHKKKRLTTQKHYYDKENFYYRIGTRSSTFDERVYARK